MTIPMRPLPAATTAKTANLKRWTENRLGMFIHWGLYSLGARHEWLKKIEKKTDEDYQKYFDHFNPDLYDPAEWAREAKSAGMKYVVLTTKHHEGFCLWDTRHTDWKSTKTPYGKDLLRSFVDAFRQEGIRIGFYYSLLDWHHPSYTPDFHHPQWEDKEWVEKNKNRDMKVYADYMRKQLEELLTGYGEIDLMWVDFSVKHHTDNVRYKGQDEWESEKIISLIRKHQPQLLINDRLSYGDDKSWVDWDFRAPEQLMLQKRPVDEKGQHYPWENCHTFSGSWGYHRDENSWKSPKQLLSMLCDIVSKGGNLLLNVGPTSRGEFDKRAKDRLGQMGEWLRVNGRSIYGCGEAPENIPTPKDTRLTYHAERKCLYVHLLDWPGTGELYVEGIAGKVSYAQLLHDGSEVQIGARAAWQAEWGGDSKATSFRLPTVKPDVEIPVVEIFLKD